MELYNTTLGGDAWANRCAFALPESGRIHLPDGFPNGFCPYTSPTFYKRPEDRILLIFHESDLTGIRAIVVFVSTLLHFSKPRRFVAWDEWKKYTWIADLQESAALFSPRTFSSGSRFLCHRPHPNEEQLLRVTVTSFLPLIEEKPSPAIGPAHNGRGEQMPLFVAARKREFDIHIGTGPEDRGKTQVMMTEDNIVITTVRQSPDHGVHILTFRAVAQFQSFRTPGDDSGVLNGRATHDLTELDVGR